MALDRDLELISAVPFFQGIGQEALKLLAFSADPRDYADKERIFSGGEVADGGLIVIDGAVELVDERRRPPKVVERLGPGTLLGEIALIVENRRPTSCFAVGPTKILFVRRALFRRMLDGYPDIAVVLEARLAEALQGIAPQIGRIGDRLGAIDGR